MGIGWTRGDGPSLFCSKSVKTRRKASHKKWSLREGSSHEDLALIEAISDLCGTVDRLQGGQLLIVRTLNFLVCDIN